MKTDTLWGDDAHPSANGTDADSVNEPKRTAARRSPLPPAHHNAPPGTSDATARWIAPYTGPMRERVFAFIRSRGPDGATDDEGEAELALKPQSYTPRRGELVTDGRVIDSGRKRPTASGCPAAVWIAVEHDERPTKPERGSEHGDE